MSEPACTEAKPLMRWESTEGDWIEVRPDGQIRIGAHGLAVTMPPAKWVRSYSEGIPESAHIDAIMQAVDWYFGPSDRQKVRRKYLELVNKDAAHLGPFE